MHKRSVAEAIVLLLAFTLLFGFLIWAVMHDNGGPYCDKIDIIEHHKVYNHTGTKVRQC